MNEHPQLERIQVQNLRESIEEQLRDAIVCGVFEPGERLVETELAERFGTSRTPVREALSTLESEGVITKSARRGYTMVELTEEDLDEIYSLRALLETEALRRAMTRPDQEGLNEMQDILDRMEQAAHQKKPLPEIAKLALSWHESLCKMANHSRLYSAWKTIRCQTQLLIGVTIAGYQDYPRVPKENHQRILDAMKDNDLRRAQTYLAHHFVVAQERAKKALLGVDSSDTPVEIVLS
jgi:DNA-binding GntR family transcriptional regulator